MLTSLGKQQLVSLQRDGAGERARGRTVGAPRGGARAAAGDGRRDGATDRAPAQRGAARARRSPISRRRASPRCTCARRRTACSRHCRSSSGSGSCRARCSRRSRNPGGSRRCCAYPRRRRATSLSGSRWTIDTRNGIAKGHVLRVDPSVQNGTVTVEVALDGALPRGARADLSVDGTIEIERLPDVLHVGVRPTGRARARSGCSSSIPTASTRRVSPVKLGRTLGQRRSRCCRGSAAVTA